MVITMMIIVEIVKLIGENSLLLQVQDEYH